MARAMKLVLLLGLFAAGVSAKGAVSAGDKDFDALVLGSGKNAFVKFLAPW